MKIVENTNIASLSPLASAIYDKLAHNQQMLFLTWECEDDELTNQVAHFLNHFDAAIAHLKGKVEFMLPLTAFHLMAHRATSKWPTDKELRLRLIIPYIGGRAGLTLTFRPSQSFMAL